MNIYLIAMPESQLEHRDYDYYDSAVVVAPDEATARTWHPASVSMEAPIRFHDDHWWAPYRDGSGDYVYESRGWVWNIDDIEVHKLGVADPALEEGVIVASFHAG